MWTPFLRLNVKNSAVSPCMPHAPITSLYFMLILLDFVQMPHYFQPPCWFLFTAQAELQEISRAMYFSSANPSWVKVQIGMLLYVSFDGGRWPLSKFGVLWPVRRLSWVLCLALKLKEEKTRGAQQWEGIRLHSIPSVQSIFPLVHPICPWQ